MYFFKCIFLSINNKYYDLHMDNCRMVSKTLTGIVSLSHLLSFVPLPLQFFGIFQFHGMAV
jgi:hypothetical protein